MTPPSCTANQRGHSTLSLVTWKASVGPSFALIISALGGQAVEHATVTIVGTRARSVSNGHYKRWCGAPLLDPMPHDALTMPSARVVNARGALHLAARERTPATNGAIT